MPFTLHPLPEHAKARRRRDGKYDTDLGPLTAEQLAHAQEHGHLDEHGHHTTPMHEATPEVEKADGRKGIVRHPDTGRIVTNAPGPHEVQHLDLGASNAAETAARFHGGYLDEHRQPQAPAKAPRIPKPKPIRPEDFRRGPTGGAA